MPSRLELVMIVKSEDHETELPLPDELIPLLNDGMGNHFCFDLSKKEPKVVFWDYFLQEKSCR